MARSALRFMAKHNDTRAKTIEMIAEMPFVNQACKKAGISRATFYRWKKDNPEFREGVDKALKEGRENISEIAEVMLMKRVRDGDINAIKFTLAHNTTRYKQKRPAYPFPPISKEDLDLHRMAMKWVTEHGRLSKELEEKMFEGFHRAGAFDSEGRLTPKFQEELDRVFNSKLDEHYKKAKESEGEE